MGYARGPERWRKLAIALAGVLLAFACGAPLAAQSESSRAKPCIAYSDLATPLADALSAARWDCLAAQPDLGPERVLLRFDLPRAEPRPDYVEIRRSALGAVHVMPLDAAGRPGSARTFGLAQAEASGIGGMVRFPLGRFTADTLQIIVAIDSPTSPMQASKAGLLHLDRAALAEDQREYIIAALAAGMIFIPLIFNYAFWRVLRERFLIGHAALALAMLLTVTTSTNLLVVVFGMSVATVSALATLGFGLTVGAGGYFASTFIEAGKLHPVLRRALIVASIAAVMLSTFHAFAPFVFRPVQIKLYMLGFLPILIVLVSSLIDAIRRNSRAAVYQLVGWGPLILVGVVRQVSYLMPGVDEIDAMGLFSAGCAFEVVATALGVGDRFMILRNQRDRAVSESRELESLAERDPLTGLLNRRAVEPEFERLRAEGFTVCALIDLDHFKTINDTCGHAVGDRVLEALAVALRPDDDTLAIRLGGEEFLLLLRGPDARRRAEERRQAITRHVAQSVTGLDRPVTASMGLVEMPTSCADTIVFADLYSRADKLLYDAKAGGRNRTISERMTVFNRRRGDTRRAVRAV